MDAHQKATQRKEGVQRLRRPPHPRATALDDAATDHTVGVADARRPASPIETQLEKRTDPVDVEFV